MSDFLKYMAWGPNGWGDEFFFAFFMTLKISLIAFGVSFVLGLIFALFKLSNSRWLKAIAGTYTTVVRALPEMLMILIVYFAVAGMAEKLLKSSGLVANDFQFSPFWTAVFSLAFVSGAFMTEVIRAGLQSVPRGGVEAATAMGMSRPLIFRRVIIPQMMRHALPGLGNLWLGVTKDSAIVSILGAFGELLQTGYRAAAATKEYGYFYGLTAVLFLLITIVSLVVFHWMEKRLNRGMA
jgi:polar amino acid transport system permease protein